MSPLQEGSRLFCGAPASPGARGRGIHP